MLPVMFVRGDPGPNIHIMQGLLILSSKSLQHIMDYLIQVTLQILTQHLIKNASPQPIKILKVQKPASLALLGFIVPRMV